MKPLTFIEIQRFLRGLIGRKESKRICVSAAVEFGADGGGIIAASWERSSGRCVKTWREFESPTELALIVRTGRIPRFAGR
jgi:hypothetical protein